MKKTLLLNYFKAATSRNPRKNTTRFNGLLALFVMVMLFGVSGVWGQVSLTSTGSPITIDFSTAVSGVCSTNVASTGSSAMMASTPAAGQLDSDAWAFVKDGATSGAAASFPGSLTADFITYTTAGSGNTGWGISNISSDRELAILPSGSNATPGSITLLITNNTGVTLNELVISYNVRAYNDQGRSNKVEFWYSATNAASSYTENTAAEFTSTEILSSSFESVSRTVTLTSLSIANNSSYYIRWFFDDVAGSGSRDEFHLDDISVTGNVTSTPTVSATGTLTPFISSSISSPSSEQSFTVSGSNLTNDIVITPPTGYQVSTTSGSSFGPSVTLTPTSGTVATTIYARFNPTALTDYIGGNIAITSTGATTQNVAVSGEVTNLSAGAIAFVAFQGASTDYFGIVALEDIPANTRIWFTDNEWDGSLGTPAFTAGEGNSVWTSPGSTITKGTVIEFAVTAGTVTNGTGAFSSGLSSTQEQLFAYQGTAAIPTFVAGFTTGITISSGTPTDINTWIPSGLTSGTNFMALSGTGTNFGSSYITSATHNRSLADMRSHIHNTSNSTTSNSTTPTYSSWPTYTFNIIADEPTTQPSFSAATAVGNNQLDLNFSGGNGTSYMVVMREASAVTASPTDATNYSLVSGSVNFASATELSAGQKIVYNGTTSTGTVTITNLSAGTTYHYAIYAYNGTTTKANFNLTAPGSGNQLTTGIANSNVSDIIIHASFTEPTNIAYASNQENSNLTVGNSEEVAQFSLRDGGATTDADANSTTLNAITFTIANHTNLRRLALYDGSTELGEVAISSGTATFSGLTLAAGDNSTKDFSLRASFAGTVTDNSQFSFTVSSVTADIAGSTFATADAGAAASSSTGDRNKIEVTATLLAFVQQPSNVSINTVMSPSVTVSANDVLANRDLDYVTDMTASTTGTFAGVSTNTVTPVSGLATFSNLQFSAEASARTIAVSSGSLTPSGNSNTFNVTILIVTGDIAFIKYQSDTPDEFSIITFVDIPATQTFYFTDNQWKTASGPLAINEQTMTWTTPGTVIPAGTVITFSNPSGSTTTVTPSGNGTGTNALNGISASGDQIFMYKGSSGSPSQFICGLNFGNSGAWQTSAGIDTSISFLPADLTNNVNAISFASDLDNGYYNNTMTGSIATLKSLINNGANWTRNDVLETPPTWSFNINSTSTTISGSATVQNLSLEASEKFVIGANTLTINGSVTGSGTLSGGATSNLTITGTSGTINLDQTTPGTTNVLKNLTISGSGTTTLGNALNITAGSSSGVVTVGTGATLTTGGFLTLKSDANGTARVSEVGSGGAITGNVTVERYLPARRAWRLLTAPLKDGSTSNTIGANWQGTANEGLLLFSPATYLSQTMTGYTTGGSRPNIWKYNSASTQWQSITDISAENLFSSTVNNGFLVFATGPHGSNTIASSTIAEATTLKPKGQLITGSVDHTLAANKYHLLGNPYASPLDTNLLRTNNPNTSFWFIDPSSGLGSYITYSSSGHWSAILNTANDAYIQSGQGFFVKNAAITTFTIAESHKVSGNSNTWFERTTTDTSVDKIRVLLYKQDNSAWQLADGILAVNSASGNHEVDAADADKMTNFNENLLFKNGTSNLAIEYRGLPAAGTLQPMQLTGTSAQPYELRLKTENYSNSNLTPYLENTQTGVLTEIPTDGSEVIVPFTGIAATSAAPDSRFRIVYQSPLSADDLNSLVVGVYPNPVHESLFTVELANTNAPARYSLTNLLGQVVQEGSLVSLTNAIPVHDLSEGVYLLQVNQEGKRFTTKLMIK